MRIFFLYTFALSCSAISSLWERRLKGNQVRVLYSPAAVSSIWVPSIEKPLPLGGKETEQSKSEDLQDESIAYIAFEEEHRSLLYFNVFCMRIFRIPLVALVGCILSIVSVCRAYSQDNSGVLMLDSLLVTGLRKSLHDASVPVQTLSADALERIGATNVGDALKHMSGVAIKDYGGIGGIKSVSIRGMGAHHTAVFYDGVAIGDCQSGQIDVGRFSTENISLLQLTIGQNDDIYQTARMFASAGTVAMDTKIPYANILKIGASAASFETNKAYINGAALLGNSWRASLFADYTSTAGNYKFSIPSGKEQIVAVRNNSDVDIYRGEINTAWENDSHSLRAKLYSYYSHRGIPGAVIVDNPISSERLESANIFGQLFYEYAPGYSLKMKATLKHNYNYDRNILPRSVGTIEEYCYRQQESDASYTVKWSPYFLYGLSVAFSEELSYNQLKAKNNSLMPSDPSRLTSLSVLSARYGYKWFTATASLLFTYANERVSASYTVPNRRRFSPSLSMVITPFGNNFSMRLSYKDIFRLPTFNDLYYRDLGNYRLQPEKSRMLNIGAQYSKEGLWCLKELNLSLDGYYGRVEDKIVATPGIFVWKMSNVDNVSLCGADANLSSLVELYKNIGLNVTAAYSFMRAVDATEGSLVKGHQIIYTPLHSGSLSAVLQTPYVSVGYNMLWSGKRYRLPQNISSNIVNGYSDHSLWLARDWELSGYTLTSRIDVMNIGGTTYEIIRYYPMPGRSWRLSFNLKL